VEKSIKDYEFKVAINYCSNN